MQAIQQFFLTNNTAHDYLVAGITLVGCVVGFALVQLLILGYARRVAKHSKNTIDDAIVAMLSSVRPAFYWFLAVYVALRTLHLPPVVLEVINGLMLAWLLYYAIRVGSITFETIATKTAKSDQDRSARRMLAAIGKGGLWVFAILLLLANLGVNITSLVAGLGIGGVAIAFALQNILADLFSSFAIYFDKPFEVGDFIIVGSEMGNVDRVGIKTTRISALGGEEIIMANRELTSTRIHNYKKMRERRIVMDFGITYETPREIVAALPAKIREVVEKVGDIRIDRVNFSGFGDSALTFEMVYYVTSGDYNLYMNRQEEINLALMELFEKEGVSFAYPTRVVYTAQLPKTS